MKMFKKLMAIALAGVMALAVLTGCGSSLNEKELIKQMNDQLTVSSMTNSSYKGFKEFKADKEMDAKAATIAKKVAEKAKTQAEIDTVLASAEMNATRYFDSTALVGRETKDAVVGVGFADATVGDSVYTIVVMKVPTQKKA